MAGPLGPTDYAEITSRAVNAFPSYALPYMVTYGVYGLAVQVLANPASAATFYRAPADGRSEADGLGASRCNVVLRRAEGAFAGGALRYQAFYDVSVTALDHGAMPRARVRALSFRPAHPERKDWYDLDGQPAEGAGPGYRRFVVTFTGAESGELSTTSAGSYAGEIAPFIQFADGATLSDHNRAEVASALSSYSLSANANGRKIGEDPSVCPNR